jgi:hypothetical protein
MIDLDEARKLVGKAAADDVSRAAREGVCRTLAAAFRSAGELLWVCGYTLGTYRRDGVSPFGFGSDATVGLALVIEIAGELFSGAITLLSDGNLYGCAALSRQIVEVEYLAWAFAEDQEEAMMWLRSTPDQRRGMWQPRHLRKRAGDRFRAADYHRHCERGGHPTPEAETLLPAHRQERWPELSWLDLAEHGVSAWRYMMDAADHLGYGDQIRSTADARGLPDAITHWEQNDRLRTVAVETLRSFRVT